MFFLELKKLLKTKGIGISIVIIFLCMVLNSVNNAGMLNRFKSDVLIDEAVDDVTKYQKRLMDEFRGIEFSDVKYQEMITEYNGLYDGTDESIGEEKGIYGPLKKYDRFVYSSLLEMMDYFQMFQEELDDLIKSTEQIRENNKNLGKYMDEYKEKEATAAIRAYSDIQNNIELKICYTTSAFWYCFSGSEGANHFNHQLLLIFICCIITIYFTSEYEGKMNQLTYTTYKGRLHLFSVKNKIVFLVSILITVFSCIIDAVIISWHFGGMTDALKQPIQLVYASQHGAIAELCPFHISFGQYMLLACFMKFTAFYFAANISVLVAVWLRKGIASIVTSILLNVGLLQFTIYASQRDLEYYEQKSDVLNKIFIWLKTYSPLSLLWSRDYIMSFDTIRLFNTPVYRIQFALVFSWLFIIVILIVNACLYCRRSSSSEFRISKFVKKIWKNGSIA